MNKFSGPTIQGGPSQGAGYASGDAQAHDADSNRELDAEIAAAKDKYDSCMRNVKGEIGNDLAKNFEIIVKEKSAKDTWIYMRTCSTRSMAPGKLRAAAGRPLHLRKISSLRHRMRKIPGRISSPLQAHGRQSAWRRHRSVRHVLCADWGRQHGQHEDRLSGDPSGGKYVSRHADWENNAWKLNGCG